MEDTEWYGQQFVNPVDLAIDRNAVSRHEEYIEQRNSENAYRLEVARSVVGYNLDPQTLEAIQRSPSKLLEFSDILSKENPGLQMQIDACLSEASGMNVGFVRRERLKREQAQARYNKARRAALLLTERRADAERKGEISRVISASPRISSEM